MNSIKEFLNIHFKKETNAIICCSGGPDSIFLTHMIHQYLSGSHTMVYFNHQQRPNEINKEITIVKKLGQSLKMNVIIKTIPKSSKISQGYFRKHRLSQLNKIAIDLNIKHIFTGHHLDDDIETLFSQLSKGSTINFRGIPYKSNLENAAIWHPLLGIGKDSIMNYLTKHNIEFCIDSSNNTEKYTRNKYRNVIKNFHKVQKSNSKQLLNTLTYLKSREYKDKQSVAQFEKELITIDNMKWILKSKPIVSELTISQFIQNNYNHYVNREIQNQIKLGLTTTKEVQIKISDISIFFDYKWILIIKGDQNEFKTKTMKSSVIIQDIYYGGLCKSKLSEPKPSTDNVLTISEENLKKVKISNIKNYPFKHKKKKLLRKASISPIQQRLWPIFYINNEIIWIPGAYTKSMKGRVAISYKSKLCK